MLVYPGKLTCPLVTSKFLSTEKCNECFFSNNVKNNTGMSIGTSRTFPI